MKWTVTACWLSQKSWHMIMRQSYHSVLQWFIADTISTETGTTGSGSVERKTNELEYFTEFYLFQAWNWQFTMLQIYVTLWGRWFVCVSVSLLRSFITLSTLQNPFDKHIIYFNQNGWFLRIWHRQLVLPLRQVENSSTCPTGQVGKSYCHTL